MPLDPETVTLREITSETVRAVTKLSVAESQLGFVASNAVSLAQALFAPEAWYRAIHAGDALAGFVMVSDTSLRTPPPATPEIGVWRLMIDQRFQGQGIGRAALRLVIEHARAKGCFDKLELSYVPGPGCPEPFYRALGFRPTGAMDDDEVVLALPLGPALEPALEQPLDAPAVEGAAGAPGLDDLVLRQATPEDRLPIYRMLELYQHDLSDIWDQDVDSHGEFGYAIDRFWAGKNSHAFVAMVAGRYAGFALVNDDVPLGSEGHWLEQFFVMKKYRRRGLGRRLAEHVFAAFPGPWEVGQMPRNLPAQAFWRRTIGGIVAGGFSECRLADERFEGVVQSFNMPERA
jgi:diamine N-acetyltransferase